MFDFLERALEIAYWRIGMPLKGFKRILGPRMVTAVVRGVKIKLMVSSEIEQIRVDTFESKEPETLDWIDAYLKPGDVFYDIGANVGIYTLYASSKVSEAKVFSFEPESQNFGHLCKNIFENHLCNVVPTCIPLADRTKFESFHVSSMDPGSAMHGFGAPSNYRLEGARTLMQQGMLGVSLDFLVYELGLPVPQHIKIDVDGLEQAILQGGKTLLADQRVQSVLIEATDVKSDTNVESIKVTNFMLERGFRLKVKGRLYSNDKIASQNLIFTREM